MRRIASWLRPTVLGVFLTAFAWLVLLLPVTRSRYSRGHVTRFHGLAWTWLKTGDVIEINWPAALVQVLGVLLVGLAVGWLLTHLARPVRAGRWHLLAILGVAAVTSGVGMVWSLSYWGYVFAPPDPYRHLADAARVEAAGSGYLMPGQAGWRPFKSFDTLPAEVADRLPDGVPADASRAMQAERVEPMLVRMRDLPVYDPGTGGYDPERQVELTLVEFTTADGENRLIVHGEYWSVANDHRVRYGVLFGPPADGRHDGSRAVLLADRWYQDVAGIEGVTWWVVALVLAVPGWVLALTATVAATIAVGTTRQLRSRARGFEVRPAATVAA